MEEIRKTFPSLNDDNCEEKSARDFNYNCLAFALGDTHNWWEPPGQFGYYYWPPGFSNDASVATVTAIIKLHGFVVEIKPYVMPVAESVAIYAQGEEWTHFARFANGMWLSKVGEDNDIAHSSLELLEGALYGKVVKVLSRVA